MTSPIASRAVERVAELLEADRHDLLAVIVGGSAGRGEAVDVEFGDGVFLRSDVDLLAVRPLLWTQRRKLDRALERLSRELYDGDPSAINSWVVTRGQVEKLRTVFAYEAKVAGRVLVGEPVVARLRLGARRRGPDVRHAREIVLHRLAHTVDTLAAMETPASSAARARLGSRLARHHLDLLTAASYLLGRREPSYRERLATFESDASLATQLRNSISRGFLERQRRSLRLRSDPGLSAETPCAALLGDFVRDAARLVGSPIFGADAELRLKLNSDGPRLVAYQLAGCLSARRPPARFGARHKVWLLERSLSVLGGIARAAATGGIDAAVESRREELSALRLEMSIGLRFLRKARAA